MITEAPRQIFEISVEDLTKWGKRPHKHSFFELVYVQSGAGFQCINEHNFPYEADNIFLLPPLDCHSFRITEPSRFYFLRFTDHYFQRNDGPTDYQAWFDQMAYVLANYNKVPGDIIASENEREFIIGNIKSIHREYLEGDSYSDGIITGLMAAILSVLARSIEKRYVAQASSNDRRFGEVLRYIHANIGDGGKLRAPHLAERFNISPNYFSEYFKKQAGQGLSEFIMKSRLRLAETKILHADLSLKEIAYQLGFTDSSHFAKAFKKTYGMTVSAFKSSGHACCS